MIVLPVYYLSAPKVYSVHGGQKGCHVPWSWNDRQL